ncbi:MAG: O-antigen ligase family protein [Clostridium sp.]|uniref:O-antigen ligase family protein n=1 Tax=Clostridium sp. TaxID=1506 RepID=UPI0025BB9F50|nr:O-antigen ligase family protein [Clostridium sp.]MCE5221761.1 O-antigen ligase family protein [Clostridium sp.]
MKTFFKEKSKNFSIAFFKGKSINFFFPIAFILTIVPLIVRIVALKVDQDTADIYGAIVQNDLFSQKKASFLLFFSIILIFISIIFFKRIFEKKDKFVNLILIGSIIFWAFTLFSAIFSTHKNYAFYGAFDRAEGFITITCYMILFIYSIYTFKVADNYKYIIIPILFLVTILSFLGVFQYIGHDLINSKLGLFLVLGTTNSKLNLMYETGKLYGTLYHYNYVGSFVAIVLPILFSLTIFQKKILYKIILGIGSLLSIWLLFGSTSRAGIIGIIAAILFGLIVFGRIILTKWKPVTICLISIIILASGLNFATKGVIFNRLPGLVTDISNAFKNTSDFDFSEHTSVKDIKHIDGHVEILLPKETLKISYENNNYVFKNSKNEVIQYIEQNNKDKASKDKIYATNNNAFKIISFTTKKINNKSTIPDYLYLRINNQPMFVFNLLNDNSIHLVNPDSKKDIDIESPEIFSFLKGKERLGSSRGYIWSRSIPLLKNNLILGGGPDTFIYQFPQNDLIGKYYAFSTPNMIVDKPHNLYLQIALNDGLIALSAFIFIMIIYIIDSIRLYAFKKHYNESQISGSSTCLGVIGYLFAGLFNDSVISVAPIFWIILGVGITLNFINRNSLKQNLDK